MSIRFFQPLQQAVDGMKQRLFSPFDLGKWLVLGFTCWLARFVQISSGGGSFGWNPEWDDSDAAALAQAEAPRFPESGFDFGESAAWAGALGAGCFLLIALGLVLIVALFWLGARGQFMFLDNVLHDRAEVKAPWHRYKKQGNSLFLWFLGFLLASLVLVLGIFMVLVMGLGLFNLSDSSRSWGVVLAFCAILVAPLVVGLILVQLFLIDFVVPIMHREGLTTNEAWRRLIPVLRRHPVEFFLYALFILVLGIAVTVAILVVGFGTCCVGFLILIIPYVGTVALLPVFVTYRLLSVHFLAQVMPELAVPADSPPPTEPPGPEPPPVVPAALS